MDIVKAKVQMLNEVAKGIPPLMKLSEKVKVEPGYILLGLGIVVPLVILITMGALILTVVVTVVYPGYKSIQALETKEDEDDDKEWLTYWCIFGVMTVLDEFLGFILAMIPFYYWIKLAFFVWLFAPQTKGSGVFYRLALKPLLLKYEKDIDRFIDEVASQSTSLASDMAKEGMSLAAEAQKELTKPENMMKMASAANQAQSMADEMTKKND